MAFRCHECDCDLKLDSSLQAITRAQANLLISKVPAASPRKSSSPDKFIPPDRLDKYKNAFHSNTNAPKISQDFTNVVEPQEEGVGQSFVYISDNEKGESVRDGTHEVFTSQDEFSDSQLPDFSKIKTLNQVFEILSANQDVAHPMCGECSDLLIDNYKMKFDQSQREKDYYISFLKKLKEREFAFQDPEGLSNEDLKFVSTDLKRLQILEDEKVSELRQLERTHEQLKSKLQKLNDELEDARDTSLNHIFETKNKLNLNLQDMQRRLHQSQALYQKHSNQLNRLRQTNGFKLLFYIQFEEDYGLINGFRLGYKVPWSECNAALGQIVSLLKFLQDCLGTPLEHYKLVPLGSKSYIVKQPQSSPEQNSKTRSSMIMQLYSSSEFSFGKLFNFNRLDVSMMALLDILIHFEKQLMETDTDLALPYKPSLKSGTLGGKSIRATANGQWTESCKYLLIDLNWILSYTSTRVEA